MRQTQNCKTARLPEATGNGIFGEGTTSTSGTQKLIFRTQLNGRETENKIKGRQKGYRGESDKPPRKARMSPEVHCKVIEDSQSRPSVLSVVLLVLTCGTLSEEVWLIGGCAQKGLKQFQGEQLVTLTYCISVFWYCETSPSCTAPSINFVAPHKIHRGSQLCKQNGFIAVTFFQVGTNGIAQVLWLPLGCTKSNQMVEGSGRTMCESQQMIVS